jgi:hypothetical protein
LIQDGCTFSIKAEDSDLWAPIHTCAGILKKGSLLIYSNLLKTYQNVI